MRLIRRIALVGLVLFAGLISVLIGLAVNHRIETTKIQNFYTERKILSSMHEATKGADPWKTDIAALRKQAFLAHIPAGTSKTQALHALGPEGFGCAPGLKPRDTTCRLSEDFKFVGRWRVTMSFDNEDKLADARVSVLK